MPLEPRQKELAAIGASIGSNCRPCIEYHLAAGREAGLTEAEVDHAVMTAGAVRDEAVELLSARVDRLLGRIQTGPALSHQSRGSASDELVALGASVGANSHDLLRRHLVAALDTGLAVHEIRSALKMAQYVQQHAADVTKDEAAKALAALESPVAATTSEAAALPGFGGD